MGDNQKIRRRRRCSECKSLDVIKWRYVTAHRDLSAGIVNICFIPKERNLEIEPVSAVQEIEDRGTCLYHFVALKVCRELKR